MQYPATFAPLLRLLKMMPRSLLLAVAVLLLLAPAAHGASRPYAVESATAAGTLADGDRYAAWVHAGAIRVLDEQTGTTASFPLPADCRPPSAIGAGVLAAICGKAFRLLDVATGVWTAVPATDVSTGLFNADWVGVDGVGAAWIAVTVEVGYHAPTFPTWIERATGTVADDDPGDLHRYADLDAAELWSPLCAPLTRRKNPYYDESEQYGSPYTGPTVIGTRAIDVAKGALVMRHCGSPRTRVITRSRTWDGAWFGGARVSWLDRRRLRTFDATRGRVRSWQVPGTVNDYLTVTHTRRHVFLDKWSSGSTIHRYAVDL
jgi:hypothetical protein